MIVFIFFIIFIPLFLITFKIFNEVQNYFQYINKSDLLINFDLNNTSFFKELNLNIDFKNYISQALTRFINSLTNIFSKILETIFNIILSLFILFYLFKDIDKFKEFIFKITPLSNVTTQKILDNLNLTLKSVIYGFLVVAIIQGFLAAIGFYIFGIKNAVFLGLLSVFASLIPTFGTGIVTLPIALYLFIKSDVFGALGIIFWGFLIVGLIDNFIRPYLIGKKSKISSIFILLSVLGGIGIFGIMGFILGPLIFSLLISLIEIYNSLKIKKNDLVE